MIYIRQNAKKSYNGKGDENKGVETSKVQAKGGILLSHSHFQTHTLIHAKIFTTSKSIQS